MSSLARYASGASVVLPLAHTDTITARTAGRSAHLFAYDWIKNNTHLFIQMMLFAVIIAALSVHITSQQTSDQINAFESAPAGAPEQVFDQLSSSEVAAVVALTTETIVSEQVVSMAQQVNASETVAATSEDFLSKPAVAMTDDESSQGITTYTVADKDTISSIAEKFGVSKDTIMWANGLDNASDLKDGMKLKIPPVNGVLYTVKEGDSAKSIAAKFSANHEELIAFNDAELTGLKAGQKIVIPGGEKKEESQAEARVYAAVQAVNAPTAPAFSGGRSTGIIAHYSQVPRNSYAAGWCTHWAAYRAGQLGNPVGPMWGNAISWPSSARSKGYNVGGSPRVGSVGQAGNHVVVVEAVKGNKIKYSDMNGLAGWGNAAMSGWVPASSYVYIHR